MNNLAIECLRKLTFLNRFKIHTLGDRDCYSNGIMIEAEGIVFNTSHLVLEEGIVEAYLFISARIEARRLVTQAKVTLNE